MVLPSLDTSEIGFICYYNVADNGLSDFNPLDATSSMGTTKEYSNGVDGTIAFPQSEKENRLANCRVKDDGWVIVWLDRSENYLTSGQSGTPLGQFDLINDWAGGNGNINVFGHQLASAVGSLVNDLDTGGVLTFNNSDVFLYNYMEPNATTVSQASHSESSDRLGSIDISIVDNTNVYSFDACGSAITYVSQDASVYFEGVQLATSGASRQCGVYDAASDVVDGQTYTLSFGGGSSSAYAVGSIMVLWS